jgi:hypothetical protein
LGNLFRVTWRVISKFLPRPTKKRKKERKTKTTWLTWSCEMQSIRHSCLWRWRHTQTHEMVTVYFLSGKKKRKEIIITLWDRIFLTS